MIMTLFHFSEIIVQNHRKNLSAKMKSQSQSIFQSA